MSLKFRYKDLMHDELAPRRDQDALTYHAGVKQRAYEMMVAYSRYKKRMRLIDDEGDTNATKAVDRTHLTRDELRAFQQGMINTVKSLYLDSQFIHPPSLTLNNPQPMLEAFVEGSKHLSRTITWRDTADGFLKLPLELQEMICNFFPVAFYGFLARRSHPALDLSLVCRSWSKRFRPAFFAKLCLRNSADVQFLHGVLSSPLSSWLAPFVKSLIINPEVPSQATAVLHPILGNLTSLSIDPYFISYHNAPRPSLLYWRLGWSSLKFLTRLKFRGVTFPSVCIFMDIIRAFKMLRQLELLDSNWGFTAAMEPDRFLRLGRRILALPSLVFSCGVSSVYSSLSVPEAGSFSAITIVQSAVVSSLVRSRILCS